LDGLGDIDVTEERGKANKVGGVAKPFMYQATYKALIDVASRSRMQLKQPDLGPGWIERAIGN
jgi:hypothetical protein